MAYNGTVEIISGLKPKNGGNFPLIDAAHVYVNDDTNLNQVLAGIEEAGNNIKEYIDTKTSGITEGAETFGARISALEETVGATAEVGGLVSMEDNSDYQLILKDNAGGVMFCIDSNGSGQFPTGVYAPNIDNLAAMVGAIPVKLQIEDAVRREAVARDDAIFEIEKRCNSIDSSISSLKNAAYRLSAKWDTHTVTETDEETGQTVSYTADNHEIIYLSTPNYGNFARVETISTPNPSDPSAAPTIARAVRVYCDVITPATSIATLADKVAFLLNKTGYTYTAGWNA